MVKGECAIVTVRRVEPSMRVKETGPAFVVDMIAKQRIADSGQRPGETFGSCDSGIARGARTQREETSLRQKARQARQMTTEVPSQTASVA